MDDLDFARQQLVAARSYTHTLLDVTPPDLWFVVPDSVHTHIAWQVGHLAMAHFRLCVYFVREVLPEDQAVISDAFMSAFRKGTRPVADPAAYPPLDEIRQTFRAIHEHILGNWWRYEQMEMHEYANCHPHRVVTTRLDALTWAARHEMLHAGQIGLVRRLLGCESMW